MDWRGNGLRTAAPDALAPWPDWLRDLAMGSRVRHRDNASRTAADLAAPPSAESVVRLLMKMPNPDDATRDDYIRVMLAAKGCIDALEDDGISDAAIDWACRWCGSPGEAAEREKWDSDFATRDAPLAGWDALLAAAAKFGVDVWPERYETAVLDFAGVVLPPETAPAGRPKRMRDRVLRPADCATLPGRGYLIKGLLAPGDVAALIGAPGCGKSTLAATICYAVAQGRPVYGMRTRPDSTVLYVAGEDFAGLRQRAHALRLEYGDARGFGLVDCENLNEPGNAADLLETVQHLKPALVVIDTLNAAWAGIEENSSEAMGSVVALARRVAATGAAVLLIHHVAKNGDGTPRGHSSLNGTLDACITLGAADEGGVIRARLSKNRNGPLEIDLAFKQRVFVLGQDSDGDPITTTIAVPVQGAGDARRPKLTDRERQAMGILAGLSTGEGGVAEADWFAACDDARVSTSEDARNRRTIIARIARNLLDNGSVAAASGMYRIVNR